LYFALLIHLKCIQLCLWNRKYPEKYKIGNAHSKGSTNDPR
jgi:hypothetical protein